MYTWNKHELLAKKLLAKILKKPEFANHYQLLLNQLNLNDSLFNPEEVMVSTKQTEIDFYKSFSKFTTGLEYFSEDTYKAMAEIYVMLEDLKCLEKREDLPHYYLSDKELIEIVREMVKSFHIKEFTETFDKIANPTLHLLNIQKQDLSKTSGSLEYVGGMTLNDPLFNKSYINVFRTYTIEDVEVLFHEVMHSIFYRLMRPIYTKQQNNIYLLQELEGQFGSLYTYDYLSQIGFKKEMDLLKKEYINTIITSSFLFMVNHSLYLTSSNATYNLEDASSFINESLKNKIIITKDELPTYLSFNGLETVTNMISSLIALEIMDKDITPQEKAQLLFDIKCEDSLQLDENLDKFDVNFKDNNFKELRKTYKELHK